jgi:hypothetical protein
MLRDPLCVTCAICWDAAWEGPLLLLDPSQDEAAVCAAVVSVAVDELGNFCYFNLVKTRAIFIRLYSSKFPHASSLQSPASPLLSSSVSSPSTSTGIGTANGLALDARALAAAASACATKAAALRAANL